MSFVQFWLLDAAGLEDGCVTWISWCELLIIICPGQECAVQELLWPSSLVLDDFPEIFVGRDVFPGHDGQAAKPQHFPSALLPFRYIFAILIACTFLFPSPAYVLYLFSRLANSMFGLLRLVN